LSTLTHRTHLCIFGGGALALDFVLAALLMLDYLGLLPKKQMGVLSKKMQMDVLPKKKQMGVLPKKKQMGVLPKKQMGDLQPERHWCVSSGSSSWSCQWVLNVRKWPGRGGERAGNLK
jgi:hypothetical protein